MVNHQKVAEKPVKLLLQLERGRNWQSTEGMGVTRIRSIGDRCGRGAGKSDGPADMCGAMSGVGKLYLLSTSLSSSMPRLCYNPRAGPMEPKPYEVCDETVT